jgi:hypothetical protein
MALVTMEVFPDARCSRREAEVVTDVVLSQMTRTSGTDWALGIEARARALVSGGEAADSCYREAIDYLGRTRLRVELGRARLPPREGLRRARHQLPQPACPRAPHPARRGAGGHIARLNLLARREPGKESGRFPVSGGALPLGAEQQ